MTRPSIDALAPWTIAAVQMDIALGDPGQNLAVIREQLQVAAGQGARLVVFPECALPGYCFRSKEEAWPHAEPVPGPSTERLATDCRELNVYCVVGMLEQAGPDLFNSAALVGPNGLVACYRKIHLPFLGVDRFTRPGDRPMAVHDLGGLRLGMLICYDGSLPEAARALTLLGADLIVLPTNYPEEAQSTIDHLVRCRAVENNIYYTVVNRVGQERGYRFLGQSQIVAPNGVLVAASKDDRPAILTAEIHPARARNKKVVRVAGEFEIDRWRDRRPEMYGVLTRPVDEL